MRTSVHTGVPARDADADVAAGGLGGDPARAGQVDDEVAGAGGEDQVAGDAPTWTSPDPVLTASSPPAAVDAYVAGAGGMTTSESARRTT